MKKLHYKKIWFMTVTSIMISSPLSAMEPEETLKTLTIPPFQVGKIGLLSLGERQNLNNLKFFFQQHDNYKFIYLGQEKLDIITHVLKINDLFHCNSTTKKPPVARQSSTELIKITNPNKHTKLSMSTFLPTEPIVNTSELINSLQKINELCSEQFSLDITCNAFNHIISQPELMKKIIKIIKPESPASDQNKEKLTNLCKSISVNNKLSNGHIIQSSFNPIAS